MCLGPKARSRQDDRVDGGGAEGDDDCADDIVDGDSDSDVDDDADDDGNDDGGDGANAPSESWIVAARRPEHKQNAHNHTQIKPNTSKINF